MLFRWRRSLTTNMWGQVARQIIHVRTASNGQLTVTVRHYVETWHPAARLHCHSSTGRIISPIIVSDFSGLSVSFHQLTSDWPVTDMASCLWHAYALHCHRSSASNRSVHAAVQFISCVRDISPVNVHHARKRSNKYMDHALTSHALGDLASS